MKENQRAAREHILEYADQLKSELNQIWMHRETQSKFVELEDLMLSKLNSKQLTRKHNV